MKSIDREIVQVMVNGKFEKLYWTELRNEEWKIKTRAPSGIISYASFETITKHYKNKYPEQDIKLKIITHNI